MSAYFTYTKTYLPNSLITNTDATDLLSATQAGFTLVDDAINSPTGTVNTAIDASAAATLATSTAYTDATAFSTALPSQGSAVAGSILVTDTVNASWDKDDITLITPFNVAGTAASAGELRLYEDTDNGTNYLSLKAPAVISSSKTLTLPDSIGASGQALKSDGAGGLVFSATGSLVFLSTVSAAASAAVDLETTFDSTYDSYLIVVSGLVASTSATSLRVRMKIGGSYLTTSTYSYFVEQMKTNGGGTFSADNGDGFDSIKVINDMNNSASASTNLQLWIHNPSSATKQKLVNWDGVSLPVVGGANAGKGFGGNTGTAALTGIRFFASGGNITSGSFTLYGLKKSA